MEAKISPLIPTSESLQAAVVVVVNAWLEASKTFTVLDIKRQLEKLFPNVLISEFACNIYAVDIMKNKQSYDSQIIGEFTSGRTRQWSPKRRVVEDPMFVVLPTGKVDAPAKVEDNKLQTWRLPSPKIEKWRTGFGNYVDMESVSSTAVAAIGYKEQQRELYVLTKENKMYVYTNVPPTLVTVFKNAPSIGKFWGVSVKPAYNGSEVAFAARA